MLTTYKMRNQTPDVIYVQESEDSPLIHLDAHKLVFRIIGPSYSADAFATYYQVVDWIEKLQHLSNQKLVCIFDFSILSSASHKMIYEILTRLENHFNSGFDISVEWHYAKFDEDMLEIGEAFSETINIPFRFVPRDKQSFFNR